MRKNTLNSFEFDIYLCYVHNDDEAMEEIKQFLEVKNKLKCCIPQRDFGDFDTDDVTAMELSLEKSATTLVLWSHAALASKWHRAEYKMARFIELYRNFNHQVIHVCLQDMSDVDDEDVKMIIRCGKYLKYMSDATDKEKKMFFDRLGMKVFGKLWSQNIYK